MTRIDNFDDDDLAEYSSPDGGSGNFTTQSGVTHDGTHALEMGTDWNSIYSDPGDGLNYYPEQGDTISFWYQPTGGGSGVQIFFFGSQDATTTTDQYECELRVGIDTLRMQVDDGGSDTTIGELDVEFTLDAWHRIEIDWGDAGAFEVAAYESDGTTVIDSTTFTDTTYTDGGVGWYSGADDAYADTLETTDEPLEQTDPGSVTASTATPTTAATTLGDTDVGTITSATAGVTTADETGTGSGAATVTTARARTREAELTIPVSTGYGFGEYGEGGYGELNPYQFAHEYFPAGVFDITEEATGVFDITEEVTGERVESRELTGVFDITEAVRAERRTASTTAQQLALAQESDDE